MKLAQATKWTVSLPARALCVSLLALSIAHAAPDGDGGPLSVRPAARPGAPNVLVWMLDDVGFAQLGSYGGLVATPNIDRVARAGLRYSNYHATPICSASRAAFLTGRNPHTVHVGEHAVTVRGYPGYDGLIPASAGTIAENMRQAGYATFALGKWDHLPSSDITPAGPYTYWPTHQGFDRFYGFLAAESDNWNPTLWRDIAPVAKTQGGFYHLNRDLADQAIAMINARSSREPLQPFFMYWATGTAHAPHHAPAEWIAKYKGKFDAGWDVARAQILKREIAQGIVPASTKLAPRPEGMPAWDSLTADERRLYARQMEVFAAALSYADEQFGRILDALSARGELNNTIVIVTADNGASAEGAYSGSYNDLIFTNGHFPNVAENMPWYDTWGGPESLPHYSFGWAVAGNTPFHYYKQTTYEGGIRVPLIVSWPKGIAARGEWRSQFVDIADLTPTILDAAQVAPAKIVNDVAQSSFDGESATYTFTHSAAPPHARAQYFEMFGNKGLWADGWKVVAAHHLKTWEFVSKPAPVNEPWQLYNLMTDPSETTDLAAKYPEKVGELDRLFSDQAARFNVNPIADIAMALAYVGRQKADDFARHEGKWVYPMAEARISEFAAPPIVSRSFVMTADVDLARGDETGPIFALGGIHGGMALYLKDGVPVFMLRSPSGGTARTEASRPLHRGTHKLTLRFERQPAMPLVPADIHVTIAIDGLESASQTVRLGLPGAFGVETFDIGCDDGSAVAEDYPASVPLPGTLRNIVFDFNSAGR